MQRTTVVRFTAFLGLFLLPAAAGAGQVTGITLSPASPVAPGTSVTVTVAGGNPCGGVEINFGDGTDQIFPVSGLPFQHAHTYGAVGTVTITAKGQGNCTGQVTASLQVAVGHVTGVTVSANPTRGTPVTVTVAGTAPCGAVQLNFGDGAIATVPAATLPVVQSHTYSVTGVVTIVAKGQTSCGGQAQVGFSVLNASATGTINTTPAPPPSTFSPNLPPLRPLAPPLPDLTADASGSPTSSTVGQDLIYQLKVRNTGAGAATSVVTKMQLPREVDFKRIDNNTLGTCVQSGTAGAAGGVFVTCTASNLAAGGQLNGLIVTRPINSLSDNLLVLYSATVNPDHTISESNTGNNTAGVATTLRSPADLAITSITINKQGLPIRLPTLLSPGTTCTAENVSQANMTVHVRVANNGPGFSQPTRVGIAWNNTVGPEFSSDCPTGTRCDSSSGTCLAGDAVFPATCFDTCSVPGLLPGASADIVFKARRTQDLSDYGVATVDPQSAISDPNRANNAKHLQ